MKQITQSAGAGLPEKLAQKIHDLAKPGVAFGAPIHAGDYTIIPASRHTLRHNTYTIRPVGVVMIGPRGVKVKNFRNPAVMMFLNLMIVGTIFWGSMLILNPPWRPETGLLDQVRELIKTIRHQA